MAARLDLEGKNTTGCINDPDCVMQNGDAIGLDGVVYGSLSRDADQVSISLKYYNVKEKKEERTFSVKLVAEPGEVASLVGRAAGSLVNGTPLPEPPAHSTSAPMVQTGKQIPGAMKLVAAPPKKRIWTWVSLGTEVASLGLGITFHCLAYNIDDQIHSGGKSTKQLNDLISQGNTYMALTWTFYALAVATTGTTIFFYWWESDHADKEKDTQSQSSQIIRSLKPLGGFDPVTREGYLGLGGSF
jgi:hypothetical protein